MKRCLFSFAFALVFAILANAQGKIYCELLGTQKFLSTKVTVSVDFGQQTDYLSDNRLVDENGNVMTFNSMVDAMNYMGKLGWEFEQAYAVTVGTGATASNVYHWLLSKYVGDDGDSTRIKTKTTFSLEQQKEEGQAGPVKSVQKKKSKSKRVGANRKY